MTASIGNYLLRNYRELTGSDCERVMLLACSGDSPIVAKESQAYSNYSLNLLTQTGECKGSYFRCVLKCNTYSFCFKGPVWLGMSHTECHNTSQEHEVPPHPLTAPDILGLCSFSFNLMAR